MNIIQALGLENKKSLFVLENANKNVYLSARNLPRTRTVTSSSLSTYDIMNADNLVFVQGALSHIEEILSK